MSDNSKPYPMWCL